MHCSDKRFNTVIISLSDSCDPSWQNRRDGLIIAGFAATIIAYSLSVGAIWLHVWYHSGEEIKLKIYFLNWDSYSELKKCTVRNIVLFKMTNIFCPPFAEFIKKKKCLVALLMVAAILSIIGGVSIASLALIYSTFIPKNMNLKDIYSGTPRASDMYL